MPKPVLHLHMPTNTVYKTSLQISIGVKQTHQGATPPNTRMWIWAFVSPKQGGSPSLKQVYGFTSNQPPGDKFTDSVSYPIGMSETGFHTLVLMSYDGADPPASVSGAGDVISGSKGFHCHSLSFQVDS